MYTSRGIGRYILPMQDDVDRRGRDDAADSRGRMCRVRQRHAEALSMAQVATGVRLLAHEDPYVLTTERNHTQHTSRSSPAATPARYRSCRRHDVHGEATRRDNMNPPATEHTNRGHSAHTATVLLCGTGPRRSVPSSAALWLWQAYSRRAARLHRHNGYWGGGYSAAVRDERPPHLLCA